MKFSTFISLALVAITSLFLFACGGGGGASTPALTADKMTGSTPVLNSGTTTITFDFGVANAGKTVTFTATPAATLTPPSTVLDALGKASVVVSAAPSDVTVNVTASIAGYTGTKAVPFIKQPDKVVVHVALTKTITDLSILTFGLQNKDNLGWIYSANAPAPGYTNYEAPNGTFFSVGNDVYQWQILVFGFNLTPLANIREITFTPGVSLGIPFFEIFQYINNPQDLSFIKYTKVTTSPATDTQSATTNLVAADFVITTDYYLGAVLLATK